MRENYTDPNTFLDFILNVTNHLTYRVIPAGSAVFHYGETGTEFFIILDGKAGIYIPKNTAEM